MAPLCCIAERLALLVKVEVDCLGDLQTPADACYTARPLEVSPFRPELSPAHSSAEDGLFKMIVPMAPKCPMNNGKHSPGYNRHGVTEQPHALFGPVVLGIGLGTVEGPPCNRTAPHDAADPRPHHTVRRAGAQGGRVRMYCCPNPSPRLISLPLSVSRLCPDNDDCFAMHPISCSIGGQPAPGGQRI